ncbi:Tetratricopeptide repeat protein 28 [Exaiptasia diaphana]|nr:Tetratricopeptide repeat protein 28 [Exaiptasia diaphana]
MSQIIFFFHFLLKEILPEMSHYHMDPEMGNIHAIKIPHEEDIGSFRSYSKTRQAKTAFNHGVKFYRNRDFPAAIKHFEDYRDIATKTSNEEQKQLACTNLGCSYYGLGKYEKAIEYHKISLKIAKQRADKFGERCAYTNLGVAHEQLARLKEALEYHEESLRIVKDIGDKKGEGMCYCDISNVLFKMGNLQKAFEYAQDALDIAVEIGDIRGEGRALGSLGNASNMLGKPEDAEKKLLRQLHIAWELSDSYSEIAAYRDLAGSHFTRGKPRFERTNHKLLEISKNKHIKAEATSNLGSNCLSYGQFNKAIEHQQRALAAAKELGDRRLEGTVKRNFGMCYQHVGKHTAAKSYFTEFLQIAKEIEDKIAEADAHQRLGDICYIQGKEDEAIKHYESSLKIAESTGCKQQEARAFGGLGKCYERKEKYEDAMKNHEKDLEISLEIKDKVGESRARQNKGDVFLFGKKYDKAQKQFQRSLQIAKELDDKQGEAVTCLTLGICCHHLSMQFKEAVDEANALAAMKQSEDYFLESIKCNEWLFHNLGEEFEDAFKVSIVDTYIHTYQLLIGKYIATDETGPEETLLVSEKTRGRALEDLLKQKYGLQRNPSKDFLFPSDIKGEVLLPQSSCLLFYSKFLIPRSKPGDIISGIGTWVLDSERKTHFDGKKITELSLADDKDSTLDTLVDKAYKTMSVRGATECEDRSMGRNAYDFKEEEIEEDYLEVLYDALITPVEDKLTGDEIIIIPDGPLFKVPFSALRNPRTNNYLSENKPIRLAPSLTTLKILREPNSIKSRGQVKGALIIGDPDVTGERMYKGEKRNFASLPNARKEAKSIAKVLGVTPLTGPQATKQTIKTRLRTRDVAVVHFAAHGDAERGEIVLSPDIDQLEAGRVPDENDYLLTINEVQEIGLRAKLVVLSCCHSGRGEIKSEGVVGMSRAFFAAGALAVVASLWAVDDLGTRVFMEKFYGHLKRGEKASVSLQQAMKEMRDIERYSRPMYWAPFFLIGEDVTIDV